MLNTVRRFYGGVRQGTLTKRSAELRYWRKRSALEGELNANNGHYREFFTEHFGLTDADYDGARVLDIGCGPRGSLEWADNAAERVGLDHLVNDYRELGIDSHAMTYADAKAENIPFPDGYFDVVSSFNSLDHVDDVEVAIGEITRVTRLGGSFLLIVEVNHPPTISEPHRLPWDLLTRFDGWEIARERRRPMEIGRIYTAINSDEEADPDRPGVLGARLIRR